MPSDNSPMWSIGFRPFFLGAAVFAAVAMAIWMLLFSGTLALPLAGVPPVFWHAHEMLFGYATAIIAGFLLTAVPNWTRHSHLQGGRLALLLCCWAIPRGVFLLPLPAPIGLVAALDMAFICTLAVVVVRPIARSGQLRRQAGIVSKLALLACTHAAFYVALVHGDLHALQTSLYAALYLIVALCLALARRLVPFFMRAATAVELPNSDAVDRASLWLFLAFWVAVIVTGHGVITALCAAALLVIHTHRLWGWRTVAVLTSPLLWVLYVAYSFFLLGFLLLALMPLVAMPLSAAVHAFAVGGIGTLTLGMMARVAWGHSGRDIARPPRALGAIFLLLVAAALARVGAAYLIPGAYMASTLFAAAAWTTAFALFLVTYYKVLTGPRAPR